MASRIMHLAVAREILAREEVRDPEGFLIGCLLPDAAGPASLRRASHFVASYIRRGLDVRTYDSRAFHGLFAREIAREGVYLGYYMHLVQDVAFRRFLCARPHLRCRNRAEVEEMHRDYRILNRRIIDSRGLSFPEPVPKGLEELEVCRLLKLDVNGLLDALRADFAAQEQGEETRRFGMEQAEEYLEQAQDWCQVELWNLREGKELMDAWGLAWEID